MKHLWLLFLLACGGAEAVPTLAAPEGVADQAPALRTGRVSDVFPPPTGAIRVLPGSFATYLQGVDVLDPSTPITTYDGRVIHRAGRVLDLPLVPGDLQQCADTAIRLRAQWLKDNDHAVLFHATSGDPLPWSRYKQGERPIVRNERIQWASGGDGAWEGYLRSVFMWAGTASLKVHDTQPATGQPQPGDLLVDPGFPGHAVILMDVATKDDTTYVLVAQGFMPAQTAHIVPGPAAGWWRWGPGLELPVWSFTAEHLRRFPAP